MSRAYGRLCRVIVSGVSRAAAMQGSAEFLAPLTRTRPSRGLPPTILNLSILLLADLLLAEQRHSITAPLATARGTDHEGPRLATARGTDHRGTRWHLVCRVRYRER